MSPEEERALLIDAIADNTASAAQRARWAQLMDEHPADADELRQQLAMAARLRALLAEPDQGLADRVLNQVDANTISTRQRTVAQIDRRIRRTPRRARRRAASPFRSFVPLALAAGLMLVAFVIVWRLADHRPAAAPTAFAELERSSGHSALTVNGQVVNANQLALAPGAQVALATGEAAVRFADGSELILEAGTQLGIDRDASGTTIRLTVGRVSAAISPQASGRSLRIRTPQAEVTIVGTAFTLSVDAERSLLEMRSGLVLFGGTAGGQQLRVAGGQRAEVRTGGQAELLTPAPPRSISLLPSADTYAKVWEPQATNGDDQLLAVKAGGNSLEDRTREVFIRFPTAGLDGEIEQAVLHLDAIGPGKATRHGLFRCDPDWEEASLSWERRPAVRGEALVIWPMAAAGPHSIDVTAALQDRPAGDINWCIRVLDDVGEDGMCAYGSREYPRESSRPRLEILLRPSP